MRIGRATRWHRDDGGQAIVLMAIVMMAMLMMIGLAIDAGQLFVARRTAQEAADAGAFGGAVVLYQTGSTTSAVTEATNDVTRNGYTNGVNGVTVTVNAPPQSGAFIGNALYIEVILNVPVHTSLVPQEAGITNVTVRGVGGSEGLNNSWGLMALAGNGGEALRIDGSANVSVTGTSLGIAVNSNDSLAAENNSGSTVTLSPGTAKTRVVGGAQGPWPSLVTGLAPIADPYGGFPKPSTTGLPTVSSLPGSGPLSPGVYTTSITGRAMTLNPGTYIMKGTGIDLTSSGQLLSGTGVFIYMAPSSYPATGGSCGDIQLEGGVNISAPTSGLYKGMLIYQDPNCGTMLHLDGGSTGSMIGTIYIPRAQVEIELNGTTTMTQLIASTIRIESPLNINYDPTLVATPLVPALTE